MRFYAALLAANVLCFLPLYLFNIRHAPNPFEFLLPTEKSAELNRLKFIYTKRNHTDPFRINLELTVLLLIGAAAGYSPSVLTPVATALLVFGIVEVTYTALMHAVFKRPPAIASDLSLLKAGLALARRHRFWMVPAAILAGAAVTALCFAAAAALGRLAPEANLFGPAVPLGAACLCLALGLYHWRTYGYTEFRYRTVYSPLLHMYRNWSYSRRVRVALRQSAEYFAERNDFREVELVAPPNIVTICVESYGSVVYRDRQYSAAISELVRSHGATLRSCGYHIASTFSEPPIFAGGSWLSYTSFTYGFKLTDLQFFDSLFTYDSGFAAYESLFHVLKRNRYTNYLLCPLGGIEARTVDWDSIGRCFQADRIFDFDSLQYRGPLVNYFGLLRLFSPPDQYSLNFAYEEARAAGKTPFSLFFCTLNSHYPWRSLERAIPDWQALNEARAAPQEPMERKAEARYLRAVHYQLDYVLKFVAEHADDDLVVIVFGDHQPPMLTAEPMGKQTPVHVLGRNAKLIAALLEHGFAPALDLTGREPAAIKHEAFLSLFMKAFNGAYGARRDLPIAYRRNGVPLFTEGGAWSA